MYVESNKYLNSGTYADYGKCLYYFALICKTNVPWQLFFFWALSVSFQCNINICLSLQFTSLKRDTHSWLNTSCIISISCLRDIWFYLLYQSTELICWPYLQIWIHSTIWRVFYLTSHQPYNVLKLCHWNVKFHANVLTIIQVRLKALILHAWDI